MNSKRRIEETERRPESPTVEDAASDPLVAALAAAEWDDEPYTEEERAAAQAGWEEYLRGKVSSWEDVRRALLDDVAAKTSMS
jgi:hypothetical protein